MNGEDDRKYMGTAAEAKAGLVTAAQKYRSYQGPRMDTAAGHRKHEAESRDAGVRLMSAALLWLWHEENPDDEAVQP